MVLGIIGAIAALLTLTREGFDADGPRLRDEARFAAVVVLFQAAHFVEELVTGLHERLPALIGLPPMSLAAFVSVNLAWLAIWSLSAWGLGARRRVALFPLWFLGFGCVVNGVGHPALSALVGAYFPGLGTSVLVGVLGGLLLSRLFAITRPVASEPKGA